jgi:hypothetical protein
MNKFLFMGVLTFLPFIAYSQNSVEGAWSSLQHPNMNSTIEYEFSWGKRNVSRQFNIIFDLYSETPTIVINNFATDPIICVNEQGDLTELTFFFRRGNFNVTMICHFNDDGTMWIEPLHDGLTFFGTGEDFVYYKIDGPEILIK